MIEIRQTDVYARWFGKLRDRRAGARILARVRRLSLGNPGDVAPVGDGVSEMRIDYGPGYRVYFKQTGETLMSCLQEAISAVKSAISRRQRSWHEISKSRRDGKD